MKNFFNKAGRFDGIVDLNVVKDPKGLYLESEEAIEDYMATCNGVRYWVDTDFGWYGGSK